MSPVRLIQSLLQLFRRVRELPLRGFDEPHGTVDRRSQIPVARGHSRLVKGVKVHGA